MRHLFIELGRVLYIGPWGQTKEHTAMVPILGAGLDGDIHVAFGPEPFEGRTVYVPSGVPRTVDAFGGRLAVMPFDPARHTLGHVDASATIDALTRLAALAEFDEVAWLALSEAIDLQPLQQVEPSVRNAAEFIDSHSDENVAGKDVAEAVGYSLSHLQELFRTQLGTSMRSYRNWSRMLRIAQLMSSAPTLTDAVVEAGFYDAAHFSRTFVATFGVMPSDVFIDDLLIHVLDDRLS